MIRWSLNLGLLLREFPFLDRFQAAADLGFAAVEFWWQKAMDFDAIIRAVEAAGVTVTMFNADGGDIMAGERGFLGNPNRDAYLRQNFAQALELAGALGCKRIHVLGGSVVPGMTRADQLALAVRQHRDLCAQAAERGIDIMLEPQNRHDASNYLFHYSADALAHMDAVGAPNLRLMYDIYHMQRMEGSIVDTIRQQFGRIGHIQLADVPGRHQPGTGELNFSFIFRAIQALGYTGYIGLEYIAPDADTAKALDWLPRDRRVEYDAG